MKREWRDMKIEELSVGDWVMNLYANKPSRVTALRAMFQDTYEIIAVSDGTQYMLIEDKELHNYEPIPLTPEILDKNGISKTYESDEYAVYKGEGFNVTEYYTELWEFERHRNRLMIRNVHQLQHALRLAGVEKEIEV